MQNLTDASPDPAPVVPLADAALREALSAMWDGECPAEQVPGVTRAYAASAELQAAWADYQWLGEALRAQPAPQPAPNPAFVAGVMARIAAETVAAPAPAAVALQPARPPAANDAVFRWKVVAGVASVCAVAALAWQVAVAPAPGAAPQWAQAPATQAPAAVAVATDHGVVLRDPQLEELMAAHRQYGSVSALQMPAGFLRNATYEAPQR